MKKTTFSLATLTLLTSSGFSQPPQAGSNAPITAQLSPEDTNKARSILAKIKKEIEGDGGKSDQLLIELDHDIKSRRILLKPQGSFSLETALQAVGEELTRSKRYSRGEEVSAWVGSEGEAPVLSMACSKTEDASIQCVRPEYKEILYAYAHPLQPGK